jgi:HlyD family secretion protein
MDKCRPRRTRNQKKFIHGCFSVSLILSLFFGGAACRQTEVFQLAGTTERRVLELSAPISEIIVDIPVQEGQQVNANDLVVQLDTEEVAADLIAQESALAAAEALLKETQGDFNRQETLKRARVATEKALDSARRMRDEALALVNEKKARIVQAKKRLNDLSIISRAPGTVDQLPYEVGERVPAGGVVAVIYADERPWIRVWLPARAVSRAKVGMSARATVTGLKQTFAAEVEYISREPEYTPHFALTERESSHLSYESRLVLKDAPLDLRPGLPAQVRLIVSKE